MRLIEPHEIRDALPWSELIDAIEAMFRLGCEAPLRHHHTLAVPDDAAATLLLMPAWQPGRYLGVKTVTVFPSNRRRALPAVQGSYQLCSAVTGKPLALLDGSELTARRTAAASALAAKFLARPDARHLLMVGTGRLSLNLIEAHCRVRPIEQVTVWGRRAERAAEAAERAQRLGVPARSTEDLPAACRAADIVSTATLSHEPLIRGEWLSSGTHLDLVGGFTPAMREADDDSIRRARVFVDTREGATKEAGDIVQPLTSGILREEEIEADLYDLCRGDHPGRRDSEEITLFKSVGTALEDLAAAILAYEQTVGAP
ncbi:MAG: ornithine cyclodeaminase family protein [Gammaproteobacteria bacterium]